LYAGAEKETFLKLKEEEEKEIRDFHFGRDSVEMPHAAAFTYHIHIFCYLRACVRFSTWFLCRFVVAVMVVLVVEGLAIRDTTTLLHD
jgi:hypothetical protein